MSQTFAGPSSRPSNYQTIFDSALEAYKKKTGKDLSSDPLLQKLEACNSPEAILDLLRAQIPGFGQSQRTNDQLTKWLDPTVNVLSTLSENIGGVVGVVSNPGGQPRIRSLMLILEAYPPAGMIFTSIGLLFSVSISISLFPFPGLL